jgi:hypothetical protein
LSLFFEFVYKPSLPIEPLFVDAPPGSIKATVPPRLGGEFADQASAAASA